MSPHSTSVYIRRIEAFAEVSSLPYNNEILLVGSNINAQCFSIGDVQFGITDMGICCNPVAVEIQKMDSSKLQSNKRQSPQTLWRRFWECNIY